MARLRIAGGGDGLQIWRIAANILNKQLQTGGKGWSSSLGGGRGPNDFSPQKTNKTVTECFSGPGRVGSCEHRNEPSGSIKGGEYLD
jgi:hypothetical protein